MAAKKLIQILQDRDENTNNNKNEIIQLGCQYGIKQEIRNFKKKIT